MIGDARDLADDHADVLRALGDLLGDAEQLLDRHRVADVVEHRRDVVEAIGVGEDLRPGRALRLLLEAAVQVADLDVGAGDALPLDLQHHAHGAVHGRVRGAHVQRNGLGRQIGRDQILDVLKAEDHLARCGSERGVVVVQLVVHAILSSRRCGAPAAAASLSGSPCAADAPRTPGTSGCAADRGAP